MSDFKDYIRKAIADRELGAATKAQTDLMLERTCGACTFCCTAKGVYDMEPPKAAWQKCEKLCASGCSVYETKPTSCGEYYCAWRLGMGGHTSRPDRAGVMVDIDLITEGSQTGGLSIHASGPYSSIPVRRMIRDARSFGIFHVGFVSRDEDASWTMIQYTNEPRLIAQRLSHHAGLGTTGWNRPHPSGKSEIERYQLS